MLFADKINNMSKKNVYWIPEIIKKIAIYLFQLSIIVFLTYIIGSYQEFLDSTQLVLLKMFELTAALFLIIGFYHIVYLIYEIIVNRAKKYFNLGIMLFGELFIFSFYILANTIIVATGTVS